MPCLADLDHDLWEQIIQIICPRCGTAQTKASAADAAAAVAAAAAESAEVCDARSLCMRRCDSARIYKDQRKQSTNEDTGGLEDNTITRDGYVLVYTYT